ncbi:HMG box protein [Purpureocillium lavendulum]|uniref:HMG box protein n=1 Tax=Purpureocillium lavendulum TaxID=1247861 RepID=A0AB34G2A1_9HYPO|nr:HMG box protein [Purpureocillium lavendulum]
MPPAGYKHGDTPKKAMVRGTISYLESQGLPVNKSAIFRHFDLSRSQGYAALSSPASSKRSDPEWEETRGRPSKVSEADQRRMEALLWEDDNQQQQTQHEHHNEADGGKTESAAALADGNEAGGFNWARLAKAAGLEVAVNPRTLHRAMGTLGYRRCLSCQRSVVHRRCREKRADWARRMLETYPVTEDWRRVRFSVELHFGFGLDGRVRLLPRPGERLQCPGCQSGNESGSGADAGWNRDIRKVHAWAATGYGFKSRLVFYEESTSPNCSGTPSMTDYQDKILSKEVRTWLAAAQSPPFILYEDVEAFAHGGLSKQNAVQSWKENAGLRHMFSCGDAPDLSPIETLWPPKKQWQFGAGTVEDEVAGDEADKGRDWDDETLRGMARRAWEGMEQERVNIWVDFMVQRLRQVVESDGRLVPW